MKGNSDRDLDEIKANMARNKKERLTRSFEIRVGITEKKSGNQIKQYAGSN
jgi:hypothetical protein